MRLLLVRTVWGLDDDPAGWSAAVGAVAAAGYDAVACGIQRLPDPAAFRDALAATSLRFVPQVFTGGRDVDAHLESLRDAFDDLATFDPPHVIVQAGRDGWPLDDAVRFFTTAEKLAADAGVQAVYETHRGRVLFNPWVTLRVLDVLPDLPLGADLSHWTCVGESMRLPDRVIDRVAANVRHVDCRVGWEEGPQVHDPRAPMWASHLERFEAWWARMWDAQRAAGAEQLAMMPEFGPVPYQPMDVDGRPLADVNELNDWMAARLRTRFGTP
jgi:hypothetical protein